MCGISGFASLAGGGSARAIAQAQLTALDHRGPDAAGWFLADDAVIAQNRLAIIDLVTGDPPITSEDGAIGVALNGEIYNFVALRDELARSGHALRTRGDTEVLAHLAEDHPPAALARRLDGMLAFAAWDKRSRRLVLGRDRLGKKPLYYWCADGTLVFASEIKGVLAHPGVPRELAPEAIPAYLTFGYVPTPRTFFAGVRSLPPGHVLTFTPGDEEPRVEPYWSPPLAGVSADPVELDPATAAREVRRLLEAAIARRLVADVPWGVFLSGGMDSSAIVGIAAQLSDRPVKTFSIGFEEGEGFDERPYARTVAERHRTEHHEFVVAPDAAELLDTLVWHYDQPFGDSSAIPTYLLAQLTRQDVTVAISGDGGDELFAGYERFQAALALDAWRRVPHPIRSLVNAGAQALPPNALRRRVESVQRFLSHAELDRLDAYRSWLSFLSESERRAALPNPDDWALRDFEGIWAGSAGARPLDRLLDLNLRTYLLDDLLVKADRMSMAHALEVRSPFLDRALVEFALRLAPGLKIRGFRRKRVLADAVADVVPPGIARRRKRGFAVPVDRWFRGPLRAILADELRSPHSRVRAHLRPALVDRLLDEHAAGFRNRGQALWMLLTLERFLRREGW